MEGSMDRWIDSRTEVDYRFSTFFIHPSSSLSLTTTSQHHVAASIAASHLNISTSHLNIVTLPSTSLSFRPQLLAQLFHLFQHFPAFPSLE
jgi:hypothetical protein